MNNEAQPIPMPSGGDKYEVRILRIGMMPKGEPSFSEQATVLEIEDLSAGEFVKIKQEGGCTSLEKWISVDPSEWLVLRDAVDFMVSQCRK